MRFDARIKKLEAIPIPVGLLRTTVDIKEDEAERIYHKVLSDSGTRYFETAQGRVNLDDLSVTELEKLYWAYAG